MARETAKIHDTLEIDEQRFYREVKPVWKAAAYFRDWCNHDPFYYPFDVSTKFPTADTPNAAENYYYFYDELYDSPDHRTKCEEIVEQRKSPWYFTPREGGYDKYSHVSYHLDTERFNAFLRDLCRERGVSLINDEVVDVEATDGHIDAVRSESQRYEADLYVDASGFNRVLKGELDATFLEFECPLDSAVTASVDRPLSDVIPATIIESGEYGWYWQIDTYDSRSFGYVFASEYVSDEAAIAEFREHVADHADEPIDEDDIARYGFSSGYFERAWADNCVAIGNAEGFVEPLQSTALTVNAHAAVKFAKLLSSHGQINDEGVRDTFNTWVQRSWNSINDFITVHYKSADGDNEFWERMQSLPTSDRVDRLVEEFDRHGLDWSLDPTESDPEIEGLQVFNPINFYQIMLNMGANSEFYEENDFAVSDEVKQAEENYYRSVSEQVDDYLTTEQMYKSVLGP